MTAPKPTEAWVSQRIEDMLAAPRMWGSAESLELQLLQQYELLAWARNPAQYPPRSRAVFELYLEFLRGEFPLCPQRPLYEHLRGDEDLSRTAALFRKFREHLLSVVPEANPFQHHAIGIRLRFKRDRDATATAVTSFYEEFRRATRTLARPVESKGRPTRELTRMSDFVLTDTQIVPKNGAPAQALLLLDMPGGQQDWVVGEHVATSISEMLTLSEWAHTGDGLASLGLDDQERRARAAFQAIRLVPRQDVELVEIGGQLVHRPQPVALHTNFTPRFLEVAESASHTEHFEREDEIRSIDLDRGTIALGKSPRITCHLTADLLEKVTEVGVRARVVGSAFRFRAGGKAQIFARSVELMEPAEDEDAD